MRAFASSLLAISLLPTTALAQDASTAALLEQNRQLQERMRAFEEQMQLMRTQLAAVQAVQAASAPVVPPYAEAFAWGDFTWLNGSSRQTTRTLDNKWFTPQFDVDVNYTYSFNQPIDNTIVGSTATFRHNEI